MEIKDFEYIRAIMNHKNLTKAAESLFITQPSLSIYIKNMEERLGFQVFQVVGKKFMLTSMGEMYLATGVQILELKDNFQSTLETMREQRYGKIRLAIPLLRSSYLLPEILPKFSELYPNVQIELIEDASVNLEKKIQDGHADVIIMNKPDRTLNMDYEIVRKEEILLAVPRVFCQGQKPERQSAKKYPYLDLKQLEDQRFILHFPNQRTGQMAEKIFRYYHMKPKNVFYTKNIETALNLTVAGYGISFVYENHVEHLNLKEQPYFFSISQPNTNLFASEVLIGYRKNRVLPPYTQEFIEMCKTLI
ncbi:LysR family transcriptional regulator [Enterococcus sp. HY326]|uniref:LysR family transcriptional regulator n=1 Tax=Enterococcus sp. HY326 TaxID=2971265 RepID=UPI00223F96C0|nr:LysR family transcriptional regulator [Enterococcus sp. HY326]